MKPNDFKKNSRYFHLNLEFEASGYFKELDWIRLQKVLFHQAQIHQIDLQALVMMDTHFHILIETSNRKENFFCEYVHKKLNGLKNFNTDCEPIESVQQYLNAYKYIYSNPVQAGLCKNAEEYEFSSLRILLGHAKGYCLISDKLKLIQNPYTVLKWLNESEEIQSTILATPNHYF